MSPEGDFAFKSQQLGTANLSDGHAVTAAQMGERVCTKPVLLEKQAPYINSAIMLDSQIDFAGPVRVETRLFQYPKFTLNSLGFGVRRPQDSPGRRPIAERSRRRSDEVTNRIARDTR